ncbi:MAG TPA: MarR family winged helix-turn-helix transcriptional regulator [Chloroflexota bacterium]
MRRAPPPGSMLLLTRLSKAVYRHATEQVLGMNLKEYAALATLRDHDQVTQQVLCETIHLDPNNCVLLLNALEGGGLAERRRDPADRRRHYVEITPAGRQALARAERALESVEEQVLGALTADERATLHDLLLRAAEAAEVRSTGAIA